MNFDKIWFEEIKSDIINRLEEIEGQSEYLCDIGFKLTECENANGSWYCSTPKARNEIAEHFDEYGAIAEYMKNDLCIETNPLLDSEKFHCQAMITLYEQAFGYAVCNFDEWDDEIEITPEFIERVKEALSTVFFEDIF